MTLAYYNEIDTNAADWLRNLIAAGVIAPGDVDTRDIRDVRASDLAGYRQCHFFAGIGVWSYALRRAGWPDDRSVWTGSCPCQPFSNAGQRRGFADERHLWPAWYALIRECGPAAVFGEQVASPDGLAWLDAVYADMEAAGYAVGAADLCAAGFGAPHIRQRIYFGGARALVHSERARLEGHAGHGDDWRESGRLGSEPGGSVAAAGDARRVGHASLDGARKHDRELPCDESEHAQRPAHGDHASVVAGAVGGLADDDENGRGGQQAPRLHGRRDATGGEDGDDRPGPLHGFWRDADWLFCRDGRWRPVEPGTFPLAHGAPARVGRLRAYGNAIVAEQAAGFVTAFSEAAADVLAAGGLASEAHGLGGPADGG